MAHWDTTRSCWRITATATARGSGKKRQRKVRHVHEPNTAAGRAAAELAEKRFQVEVAEALSMADEGQLPKGTFGAKAREWCEQARGKRGQWSVKTKKETRYALERYVLPHIGNVELGKLTAARLNAMYAAWEQGTSERTGEPYALSAMRRWHGMVNAILAQAARDGDLVGPNPMARATAPGGSAPERDIPPLADVRAAITNAPSLPTEVFFELAAETGARRGTLLGLRWQDVDLAAGTLHCVHAIAEGEDGAVLKSTKSGRAYLVHLGRDGRALVGLAQLQRQAQETALALGYGKAEQRKLFVFSNDGGEQQWDVGWPSHAWRKAADAAGLTMTLHDVRHFAASNMLAHGVPSRVVAERLGCTEANVIRTYSHRVASPADQAAAEVMAQLLA